MKNNKILPGLMVSLGLVATHSAYAEIKHSTGITVEHRTIVSDSTQNKPLDYFVDFSTFSYSASKGKVSANLRLDGLHSGIGSSFQNLNVAYKSDSKGNFTVGNISILGKDILDVNGLEYSKELIEGEDNLSIYIYLVDTLVDEDTENLEGSAYGLGFIGSQSGFSYKLVYAADSNYSRDVDGDSSTVGYMVGEFIYTYLELKKTIFPNLDAKLWYESFSFGEAMTYAVTAGNQFEKGVVVPDSYETISIASAEFDYAFSSSESGNWGAGVHLDHTTYAETEALNFQKTALWAGYKYTDGLKTDLWLESYSGDEEIYSDEDGEATNSKMVVFIQNSLSL